MRFPAWISYQQFTSPGWFAPMTIGQLPFAGDGTLMPDRPLFPGRRIGWRRRRWPMSQPPRSLMGLGLDVRVPGPRPNKFLNVSRPGSDFEVGDRWRVEIYQSDPGMGVMLASNHNGQGKPLKLVGSTNSNGDFRLEDAITAIQVGDWWLGWYVGHQATGYYGMELEVSFRVAGTPAAQAPGYFIEGPAPPRIEPQPLLPVSQTQVAPISTAQQLAQQAADVARPSSTSAALEIAPSGLTSLLAGIDTKWLILGAAAIGLMFLTKGR